MYICRRTFGFKKDADNISLSQLVSGITTKEGAQLDGGTGLSKSSVARALKDLEDKNIILRVRRSDPKRGDLPTTYQLNIVDPRSVVSRGERGSVNSDTPRVPHRDTPLSQRDTPRVPHRDTQETEIQQTVEQETENTTTQAESVVASLVEWGISQNVSETLAHRYTPERIHEKIDFLKHLIENEPNTVKKPAAWLRKAIEEDYSAPDSYKTALSSKHEQVLTKAERTRKKAVLEAEKARSERSEQLQKAREAAFTERLQTLFQRFNTSEHELRIWDEVKAELANQGVSDAILTSLQLLKLDNGSATLNVINNFMAQQASQTRVKEKLIAVLSQIAQQEVHIQFVVDGGEKQREDSG